MKLIGPIFAWALLAIVVGVMIAVMLIYRFAGWATGDWFTT